MMFSLARFLQTAFTGRIPAQRIEISQFGLVPGEPRLAICVIDDGEIVRVDVYPDDDAGNARATVRASDLQTAHGYPVIDRRAANVNAATSSSALTGDWMRRPRAA